GQRKLPLEQPSGEPDLQLLRAATATATTASASAASAAASGDADVPGRHGDPGNGHLPGSAASASAATAGARARLSGRAVEKCRSGLAPGPVFLCLSNDAPPALKRGNLKIIRRWVGGKRRRIASAATGPSRRCRAGTSACRRALER